MCEREVPLYYHELGQTIAVEDVFLTILTLSMAVGSIRSSPKNSVLSPIGTELSFCSAMRAAKGLTTRTMLCLVDHSTLNSDGRIA